MKRYGEISTPDFGSFFRDLVLAANTSKIRVEDDLYKALDERVNSLSFQKFAELHADLIPKSPMLALAFWHVLRLDQDFQQTDCARAIDKKIIELFPRRFPNDLSNWDRTILSGKLLAPDADDKTIIKQLEIMLNNAMAGLIDRSVVIKFAAQFFPQRESYNDDLTNKQSLKLRMAMPMLIEKSKRDLDLVMQLLLAPKKNVTTIFHSRRFFAVTKPLLMEAAKAKRSIRVIL